MNKPTIFLDMDELLADFIGGACRAHGVTVADLDAARVLGEWSITGPMGRVLGRPLSLDEFWEPINAASPFFWESLDELPTFAPLIELAEHYDWYIVTAPSRAEGSCSGKVRWLRRKLGNDFDRFFITPHKELLAQRGRILVDDRAENCRKFAAAGGQSIIFPHLGNELHAYASDPVSYVRYALEELCRS